MLSKDKQLNNVNQPNADVAPQLTLSPIGQIEVLQGGSNLTRVIVSWPAGGSGQAMLAFTPPAECDLTASFNGNSLPPNEANRSVSIMTINAGSDVPAAPYFCHVQVYHSGMLRHDVEVIVKVIQPPPSPALLRRKKPQ
jgi:hypothetical protein